MVTIAEVAEVIIRQIDKVPYNRRITCYTCALRHGYARRVK